MIDAYAGLVETTLCAVDDEPCVAPIIERLQAPWPAGGGNIPAPGAYQESAPHAAAAAGLDAALMPPGEIRNSALMTLASLLIGQGDCPRALELALLRPGWSESVNGPASSGTAALLAGVCQAAAGEKDIAIASFRRAAADPNAVLWDRDGGLPVAPLARLELKALAAP